MSIINKIKELISNLKPKLKNAHCVYFEGQTGLCQAKEFKKCNPMNCELYTIDELSTILDLQDKLQAKEQECEELKAQVDEWKENCNNNFELVAIRTKLLTDIAIKLGLNTAIIEHKDVFDKIDNLQSKEHELEEIKKEFQVECLQDNITGKRTYRSLKVIKLKEELEEDFEETKEDLRECEFDRNIAQLEANKYKQALDKIEEFCIVYSDNHDAYETVYKQILDIINKA